MEKQGAEPGTTDDEPLRRLLRDENLQMCAAVYREMTAYIGLLESDDNRVIMRERLVNRRTFDDIAAQLKMPEANVRGRFYRTQRKLFELVFRRLRHEAPEVLVFFGIEPMSRTVGRGETP